MACARDRARTEIQLIGDLPTPWVTPSRPFTHTGLDYAGPYLVRSSSGRGIKSHKAWISVLICFAVKAIHLELVHDYSTASFLAALRRFVARRWIPTDVYSDNGPNFRGTDRELLQVFRKLQNDPNLISHLAADGRPEQAILRKSARNFPHASWLSAFLQTNKQFYKTLFMGWRWWCCSFEVKVPNLGLLWSD